MNIKLILPPDFIPRTKFSMPPMGIASLAGQLKKSGFNVELDDLDTKTRKNSLNLDIFNEESKVKNYLKNQETNDRNFDEQIRNLVDNILKQTNLNNFQLIGFSIAEPSHLLPALCLAKRIKETDNPNIVIGGRIGLSDKLLDYGFIDYVIIGDGEKGIEGLANSIKNKIEISEIPNLIYSNNGKTIQNKMEIPKIEDLPAPLFESLPLELYENFAFETRDPFYETYSKQLPMITKDKILILPYYLNKGCPFNCIFFKVSAHEGSLVDYKTPEKIRKELKEMIKKYNTRYFFFMDSTLNGNLEWLSEVCEAIKDLNIFWSDSAVPTKFPEGFMKKLRNAGCIRITWGVESLSKNILKKMHKGFNPEIAMKTLKESHEAGIWNYTNWIAGFPHEKEEELNETLENIKKTKEYIDDYTVTGFILQESDINNNPENYGIKHLKKDTYTESAKNRMETGSFNEIGGLCWNEKRKQIEDFKEKMNKTLEENKNIPVLLPMHSLYYFYSKFDDKKALRDWLNFIGTKDTKNIINKN